VSEVEIALIGGSLRTGSAAEQILRVCADLARRHGARTSLLTAPQLVLPPYVPDSTDRPAAAHRLLATVRAADGVIVATPTYHGGMSGLVKNALDHLEDLAADAPAYLDGKVVGTVAVGWSEHGAATAITDLRNTVLSLRGWTTPMAVTVNSANSGADGWIRTTPRLVRRLEILVGQVLDFAAQRRATRLAASA
jgi:FMN reductase